MIAQVMSAAPSLHTVRLADVAPQAWRNGGGTTQELLAWPSAQSWALRISVARIDRAGPFSAFPGVQRFFCVLQGSGVRLSWPLSVQTMTAASPPLAFNGADPPDCGLIDGPTTDLNLMVSQDAGSGTLIAAEVDLPWTSTASWRAAYVVQPCQLQRRGHAPITLPAMSLSWHEAAAGQTWSLNSSRAIQAWWIDYQPQAQHA